MGAVSLIFTLVIVIILCQVFSKLYGFIKFCVAVNKIPGPAPFPWPFIATSILTVKFEGLMFWLIDIHLKCKEGIMQFAVFDEAYVLLRKPHHLEVILSNAETITKAGFYNTLHPWLGDGLITSTGKKWFCDRKLLTPSFHSGVIDQFTDVISEKAEVLIQCIEDEINKNAVTPIDFYQYSIRCTLDIMCETAMGANIDFQRNPNIEYTCAMRTVIDSSVRRIFYPWFKWESIFYRSKLGKEFKTAIKTIRNFTMQVIEKKRQLRNTESKDFQNNNEKDEFGKRRKKAFLDLLLDLNENETASMSDDEIRQQVDTFLFAGHDTTGVAINWVIFNLGNNPEVQEKVHQELEEVFGDSKEPATMNQIAELTYLDRVIKENLRLHPSVPLIGRHLTKSIELDGYVLPKGCNISMHIITMQRDPEIWPDPTKFDPDRFLPENSIGRHRYAYIPFSAGLRNCIGQKFASVEQKIVLTAILRKWRVKSAKTPEEMNFEAKFILVPFGGNPMYFIPKRKEIVE